MEQWMDDTLTAIALLNNGRYAVWELPARQTDVMKPRRTFAEYEQAESYIEQEYQETTQVEPADILEEQERRNHLFEKRQ